MIVRAKGLDLLRDLLSVEPAIILNAAFCERHKKHCSPSKQLEEECAKVQANSSLSRVTLIALPLR